TVLAGVLMIRFIKYSFITAPIFLSLWYMSMDSVTVITGRPHEYYSTEAKYISMAFGIVMLLLSYTSDRRTKIDYAFWGYLFGAIAFWGGLTSLDSNYELGKFIYFLINLGFIMISLLFDRRIFIVLGALGSLGYLHHLADKVFKDFISFPIAISLLGLGVISLGVYYQKNKTTIHKAFFKKMPQWLIDLSPKNRAT
ncbi:MAG: hypothetical protein K2Q18_04765, partial [Bdellovibrionales bacterium]|nr:hypothetical protein [Bdellovibrionales bacterium]